MKQAGYIKPSPRREQPKKQDRKFRVDLGQNDGPFKDSFENYDNVNVLKPPAKHKEGLSLKEELNREQPENYDTVNNVLQRIEESLKKAVSDLMEYKEKEMNLRDEIIRDIHDAVEKGNATTLENLRPVIQNDYRDLKQGLKTVKEESEQLHKQLLRIRKDFSTMSLQINSCDGKTTQMHKIVLGEAEQDFNP
eukprot:TRINITY_DN13995_c0_g2_i1.p1 TRINITY_DN13995_c0_g2~~TRINITY_DN13995_c0_g2_i1.p1  ORF type:complete len:193 (-),score=66.95 TRINITY_DN13995_c0_g2_i1:116-694(-)